MKSRRPLRIRAAIATAVALVLAKAAPAQSTDRGAPNSENPEAFSRLRGLFDVDLPRTVEQFSYKLILHPHFGDLLHRDYLRVPVGVRVGLNDHTEASAEVESYVTHGLKKTRQGYGVGVVRLGGKYQWLEWLKPAVDTSTGINVSAPVGRPPIDMTDGFYHVAPYVTFSKRWPDWPRLTPFVSVGTDLMWHSSVPGSFRRNDARSDSMGVSAGCFVDASERFKYTLVCSYWTTALIGRGDRNFVSVNPSVLWQIPEALTFHSKGKWILGAGVKANFGPEGTDFSTSAKLRGEFSFMRRARATPARSGR